MLNYGTSTQDAICDGFLEALELCDLPPKHAKVKPLPNAALDHGYGCQISEAMNRTQSKLGLCVWLQACGSRPANRLGHSADQLNFKLLGRVPLVQL